MNHELKDSIITAAAIAVPVLTWLMTKMDLRFAYGQLTKEVAENSRRITTVEATISEHTEDIGYLKGRVNGQAIGKARTE